MLMLRRIKSATATEGFNLRIEWLDGGVDHIDVSEVNQNGGFPFGNTEEIDKIYISNDLREIRLNEKETLDVGDLACIIDKKHLEYTQFGLWEILGGLSENVLTWKNSRPSGGYIEHPPFFNFDKDVPISNAADYTKIETWYAFESARAAYEKFGFVTPLYEVMAICQRDQIQEPSWLKQIINDQFVAYHQGTILPKKDRARYTSYCDAYRNWHSLWAEQVAGRMMKAVYGGKNDKEWKTAIKKLTRSEAKRFVETDINAAADRAEDEKMLTVKSSYARKKFAPFHSAHAVDGWIYVPNPSLLPFLNTKGTSNETPLTSGFGRWLPSPWAIIGMMECLIIIEQEILYKKRIPGANQNEAVQHISKLCDFKSNRISQNWPNEMFLGLRLALNLLKSTS